MAKRGTLLAALGGEAGCERLSAEFYARVRGDAVLRPLFPGKSMRCAIEQFAAFLIQFLDGDEARTEERWWLSLRESHARFRIGPAERRAWLRQMEATLAAAPLDEAAREALRQLFEHSSAYVAGEAAGDPPQDEEAAARWSGQRTLDDAVAAIAGGRDDEAISLARKFRARPAVFVRVLARMIASGRAELVGFAVESVEGDRSLAARRGAHGRTLLHWAAGAGCLEMVRLVLGLGVDPDIRNGGGHTPLYCAANECASEAGAEVVRALVGAGADVNACTGVTRATALHMAARRGFVGTARALLECGASIAVRDRKGDTPLQRALNCRKAQVAELIRESAGFAPGS